MSFTTTFTFTMMAVIIIMFHVNLSNSLPINSTLFNSTLLNFTNHTNETVTMYGGCSGTEFGCCEDNRTFCSGERCLNCNHTNETVTMYGGCSSTEYGCCEDNRTFCSDERCLNCNIVFSIY